MAELADAADLRVYGMTIYGPYKSKDGRLRIVIKEGEKLNTISYPRFIMERHLGRSLLQHEDVHHKDENPLNNEISNLELISHVEHCRNHSLKHGSKYSKNLEFNCVYCGRTITLNAKQQRDMDLNLKRNKRSPFCSKHCIGKYTTDIQRAAKKKFLD